MKTYIISEKERETVQSVIGRLLVGDPSLQLMRSDFKDDLRKAATILQTLSPSPGSDPDGLAETLRTEKRRK